jgi:predicted O-methyltransferase YrrM
LERTAKPGSRPTPLRVLWTVAARVAVDRVFRPVMHPGLDDFGKSTACQTVDVSGFVGSLTPSGGEAHGGGGSNFRAIFQDFLDQSRRDAMYPESWRVETTHAEAIYRLVKRLRPDRVVETGVADGLSTTVILKALDENNRGMLTSIDVARDVGRLVPQRLRSRWEFRWIDGKHSRRELARVAREFRSIDMFLHDSEHTYYHQRFEYELAWSVLRSGGLLLSDDADISFSFLDFARRARRQPSILVGDRKVLGGLTR